MLALRSKLGLIVSPWPVSAILGRRRGLGGQHSWMGQIADEQITSKLRDLLKEVDLQTTTGRPHSCEFSVALPPSRSNDIKHLAACAERQLRKALEEEFQIDLSDRKEIIRAEVGPMIGSLTVCHSDWSELAIKILPLCTSPTGSRKL